MLAVIRSMLLAAFGQVKREIAGVGDRGKRPIADDPVSGSVHFLCPALDSKVMPDLTSGGFKHTNRGAPANQFSEYGIGYAVL